MASWKDFTKGAARVGAGAMTLGLSEAMPGGLWGTPGATAEDTELRNREFLDAKLKGMIEGQAGQIQRAGIDQAMAEQRGTLGRMTGLAGQLQAQAAGRGGAGTMAAERNLLNQQRAIQSMAASTRGITAGSAMRTAAQQNAILAAEGAGQIGQVRAGEQAAALGQLQGLYGTQAGMQGQMAGLEAGISGQNLQAQQDQQRLALAATGQLQGMDQAEVDRLMAVAEANKKPGLVGLGLQFAPQIIGGAMGGPAGAAAGARVGGAMSPQASTGDIFGGAYRQYM